MRKGRKQKINWAQKEAPKFSIETKDETECGAWALHAITKVPLHLLMGMSKKGHWPTRTMIGFLRRVGCEVTPITLGNVVESQSVKTGKKLLTCRNVILVEQGCFKEESTWSVLFDNKISHSGELNDIRPMEFVNWPILQAYLITHKAWSNDEKSEK